MSKNNITNDVMQQIYEALKEKIEENGYVEITLNSEEYQITEISFDDIYVSGLPYLTEKLSGVKIDSEKFKVFLREKKLSVHYRIGNGDKKTKIVIEKINKQVLEHLENFENSINEKINLSRYLDKLIDEQTIINSAIKMIKEFENMEKPNVNEFSKSELVKIEAKKFLIELKYALKANDLKSIELLTLELSEIKRHVKRYNKV